MALVEAPYWGLRYEFSKVKLWGKVALLRVLAACSEIDLACQKKAPGGDFFKLLRALNSLGLVSKKLREDKLSKVGNRLAAGGTTFQLKNVPCTSLFTSPSMFHMFGSG